MSRLRFVVVLLSLGLLAAACSKSSESNGPTAPSAATTAPAAGALVTGTVQATAAATGAALTVQVTGTSLSTAVSAVGQFSIANVPAGPVELRFSAPGVDAKVTVGTVAAGETLNVTVQVSGSSAVVRTEDRNNGSGEQRIIGDVARLTGTASAFTLFIGTREVRGTSSTQFTGQGSSSEGFTNLRNGATVEVRGSMTGEVLNATRVHLEDDNEADDDDEDEAEFVGRITSITGTQPDLTLIVNGRTVRTSSSTIVRRRGNVVGLAFLALQQEVEVEGRGASAATGTIEASKITVEDEADDDDDDDDDDDEGEVEVTGNLSGLSSVSSCPSVSFSVSGTSFTTNSSTEFRSACSGLRNGDRVEVKGRRTSPTGPVTATRVKRE